MDALEFLKERKRMCDYYSHCKGCPLDGSKCVIEAQAKEIERLRAQVVHGRWIYDEKAQRPYCSICKEYFYGAINSSMNYCSNCGAKMDGDDGHACL